MLERPLFVPQRFICLGEKDKTFSNEKNVKTKILIGNWRRAMLAEILKKWVGQGFIFHAINPALYPFS